MAYIYETADESYLLLKQYAKENRLFMTEAERALWDVLRNKNLGYKFRRQHIIGPYIADFANLRYKIVVEIDGKYHFKGDQPISDEERTADLRRMGFTVIRFTNEEVIGNPNKVMNQIKNKIEKSKSPTPPSPKGEGVQTCGFNPPPLSGRAGWGSAWAVDAACSGNPGPMEYRCIDLLTGAQVFHFGPMHGTNNIGEFLAIVHALALMEKQGIKDKIIYSDSMNAITWVNKKQCKTKLERTPATEQLYQIIHRAEVWLRTHPVTVPIVKWDTQHWGEIPADFGRK